MISKVCNGSMCVLRSLIELPEYGFRNKRASLGRSRDCCRNAGGAHSTHDRNAHRTTTNNTSHWSTLSFKLVRFKHIRKGLCHLCHELFARLPIYPIDSIVKYTFRIQRRITMGENVILSIT